MHLTRSLSGRLLLLTIAIVMAAEVFVFLPSIARFREDFLIERLRMAQIASLALLAAEDDMVEEALEEELLANAGVTSIVLRRDSVRQLILSQPTVERVVESFDLRQASPPTMIWNALTALVRGEPRLIRVIGQPALGGGQVIEITLNEVALTNAMRAYSNRILIISIIISATTGILIFFICRRLIVRPMQRVVGKMMDFQQDPERAPVADATNPGIVEIAQAETALAEMQSHVRGALKQKSHLAELGSAVAKISHDLRNMLSTAQLMADRLDGSQDPLVARVGPKLIGSIDRAVNLCVSTLKHGRADEAPPEPRRVALQPLAAEIGEAVFPEACALSFVNGVEAGAEAMVDPEHLFRILSNLVRNARQAMESAGRGDHVSITAAGAEAEAGRLALTISDNGPGMPAKAMENIFQPFIGSTSRGGSGLGLAIAHELAAANGGALTLVRSTTEGTVFRLELPA